MEMETTLTGIPLWVAGAYGYMKYHAKSKHIISKEIA